LQTVVVLLWFKSPHQYYGGTAAGVEFGYARRP